MTAAPSKTATQIGNRPKPGQVERGGVQVISRAARILRTLGNEPEGLSLGGIAERVDLPRSTVQRIVNALASEALVTTPSPMARIRLGSGLLALASRSRFDMVEIAHPFLKALSAETGETIDLAILRGDHIVFVDQVIGSQRLRAVSAVGEQFPLHSTASGKACLALLPDREVRAAIGDVFARTSDQHEALDRFLAEIAEVRRTGLAHDEEEHSSGISAIGVGLRDRIGDIYAVSIPAPTSRAHIDRERKAQLLLKTRCELEQLVGGDA